MNVLHVCKTYLPAHGGVQRVVKRICDGATGMRSTVLTTDFLAAGVDNRTVVQTREGNRTEVVRAAAIGQLFSMPIAPGLLLALWKRIHSSDLVVVHYPFPIADLAIALYPFKLPPVVVYWHSEIVFQKRIRKVVHPFTRRMLSRASCIVVSSPLLPKYSGMLRRYSEKIQVIPFGYTPSGAVGISQRRAVDDPYGPLAHDGYFLCVGRHVPYKGIDILIRAAVEAKVNLRILGYGPLLKMHKKLHNQLGGSSRIRFVENADDDEVERQLKGCMALVLPSLHENEAFGLVQIEAMAFGKPVVNTRLNSGVPWVARDQIEALTVEPGNVGQLGGVLRQLNGNFKLRNELGERAFIRWQSLFTEEQFLSRTESLYRSLI